MTRATAVALGLALCLSTGCFIFDEIDQGRELMKKHSGQNPDAKKQSDPAPDGVATDEGPGLIARVQQMIQDYREPGDPERAPDDGIVRCDFEHGLTFTNESDCLSRGGSIL
ncbi:MAG: hypothetical protein E4H11_04895 [Myxococcales bacterium]|jgi:hypothetical protein|nr:MAG: hypothetical protein E4H11_04895 [Myxococcales bacterium]